jgi:hypothetical protein
MKKLIIIIASLFILSFCSFIIILGIGVMLYPKLHISETPILEQSLYVTEGLMLFCIALLIPLSIIYMLKNN